jgi:uncharacterized protein (DUF58 family)
MALAPPSSSAPRGRSVKPEARDALVRPVAPIDLDLMASLPSLPLRARYLVESFLTGRHRSPIKGTSPEFAEYSSYQPGDDLRRIDWRLYGRSDRLCVKKYEDENQLRVCLALDASASLRYASQPDLMTKADLARTVLAAVLLLARRQSDAVGLALLGDTEETADGGVVDFLRPSASLAQQHTLFSRLENPPVARSLDVGRALPRLAALLPRGGIVVLTSDFYCDLAELRNALQRYRSQRLDLVAVQVLDPMEIEFGEESRGRFVDLESGAYVPLDASSVRAGYLKRFGTFQQDLHELFREHGAELVTLRTDESPMTALAAYFARRARIA